MPHSISRRASCGEGRVSSARPIVAAILLSVAGALPLAAAGFEAGVARVSITPPTPFWMSGYATRTRPSEGVEMELWAKALAVRDGRGGAAVVVTTDLIGLPRAISEEVAARVESRFGVKRAALVLTYGSELPNLGPEGTEAAFRDICLYLSMECVGVVGACTESVPAAENAGAMNAARDLGRALVANRS